MPFFKKKIEKRKLKWYKNKYKRVKKLNSLYFWNKYVTANLLKKQLIIQNNNINLKTNNFKIKSSVNLTGFNKYKSSFLYNRIFYGNYNRYFLILNKLFIKMNINKNITNKKWF